MRVITIANEKGGVGKTTVTVNLAAALGLLGQRVLVIDLDGQGHATEWLGVLLSRIPAERSSYAVLIGQATLAETILRTGEPGVTLCGAHAYLAKAARDLGEEVNGFFMLSDALRALIDSVATPDLIPDYVIIDCPPSKGPIVFNALIVADLVVAPVLAEALSLKGLSEIQETVRRLQQRMAPDLPDPRILINNYDGRAGVDRQIYEDLRDQFADHVLATEIGRDAPLREAFAAQISIFRHRRGARSALQFRDLANEIVRWFDER